VHSPVHCRYKAVTSFGNGLYIERTFGIIAERISYLPYGEVEASLIIDKGVGAPNLLNNLVPGYGFSATADQQGENLGGLWLEPD